MTQITLLDAVKVHDGSVGSLQFSPAGDWLVSASHEWHEEDCEAIGAIKVWDATLSVRMSAKNEEATGCASLSQDGETIAWSGYNGTLRRFRGPDWQEIDPLVINPGDYSVDHVCFTPDGKWLLACVNVNCVQVWNALTFEPVETIASGRVGCLAVSSDAKLLATRIVDGGVRLWNLLTFQHLFDLGNSKDRAGVVVFSKNNHLAVAGLDGSLEVWDLSTGRTEPLRLQANHEAQVVQAMCFLSSSELLTGDEGGNISIWDLNQGRRVSNQQTFRQVHSVEVNPDESANVQFGSSPAVTALALSSNRSRVAVGNAVGGVQFFAITPSSA
jgi:WD40 repeat protein